MGFSLDSIGLNVTEVRGTMERFFFSEEMIVRVSTLKRKHRRRSAISMIVLIVGIQEHVSSFGMFLRYHGTVNRM